MFSLSQFFIVGPDHIDPGGREDTGPGAQRAADAVFLVDPDDIILVDLHGRTFFRAGIITRMVRALLAG
jgi:hypothetical protein